MITCNCLTLAISFRREILPIFDKSNTRRKFPCVFVFFPLLRLVSNTVRTGTAAIGISAPILWCCVPLPWDPPHCSTSSPQSRLKKEWIYIQTVQQKYPVGWKRSRSLVRWRNFDALAIYKQLYRPPFYLTFLEAENLSTASADSSCQRSSSTIRNPPKLHRISFTLLVQMYFFNLKSSIVTMTLRIGKHSSISNSVGKENSPPVKFRCLSPVFCLRNRSITKPVPHLDRDTIGGGIQQFWKQMPLVMFQKSG